MAARRASLLRPRLSRSPERGLDCLRVPPVCPGRVRHPRRRRGSPCELIRLGRAGHDHVDVLTAPRADYSYDDSDEQDDQAERREQDEEDHPQNAEAAHPARGALLPMHMDDRRPDRCGGCSRPRRNGCGGGWRRKRTRQLNYIARIQPAAQDRVENLVLRRKRTRPHHLAQVR